MKLFERLWSSLRSGRSFSVKSTKEFRRINPDNPEIGQNEFETDIHSDPTKLSHSSREIIYIADCGHPVNQRRGDFFVFCSCQPARSFCLYCSIEQASHCESCGSLVFPCCRVHSHMLGKDYCPRHRHAWIRG